MDESEIITSEGKGVWGARYELRLLTSVRTYSASLRQANKTVQRYVLEFGPTSQASANFVGLFLPCKLLSVNISLP
jgi:hypothetical protein